MQNSQENPMLWQHLRRAVVVPVLLLAGCGSHNRIVDSPDNFSNLDDFVQVLDSSWTVDDGVIASRQNPSGRLDGEGWLLTRKFYTDFTLRLKFRLTPGGNSGVFVRVADTWQGPLAAPLGGSSPWDAGYEVNINNDEPNYPTGSIWALAKGPKKLQVEGEWNDLEITVAGNRIWTWVNGTPAIEGAELPPRSATGAIGFQRHGGEQYREKFIEFRDVEIAEADG